MKTRSIFLLLLVCLPLQSLHAADTPLRGSVERAPSTAELQIPKIDRAPKLEEFTAMNPSPAWEGKLAVVHGFMQRVPDDGKPATQATDVYLGYDDHALHIVFVAHDLEPEKIRARLDHRESIADDEDKVGIYLDTFHDRRRAYQFVCNPLGVQDDSLYSEDADSSDEGFDTVWTSRGTLTPGGYVVLMSIPFKSLRFAHKPSQTWNVALWRNVGRRSETAWWPRVSAESRGILSQAATATGMESISPGRNLQFVPYTSWRAYHSVDTRDPLNPIYTGQAAQILAGLDAKAILKDSLVLDLTVKPDFRQVESDQPQTTTNQLYELYYPEMRPFFTENSSYFDVPMVSNQRLLFTRRIVDPDFGARLTGKLGHYSIGTLFADDRSPGESVPRSDPAAGKHAYFDVFRLTRDLPSGSNVGASYLERRFQDTYSRVVDLDTTLNMGQTWKGTLMGAYNWNRFGSGPGLTHSGGDLDANLTRVSRGFNYTGFLFVRAPGFQPETAFYEYTNWRETDQTFAYQFWPKNSWITRIWSEVYAARSWHFDGVRNWEGLKPRVKVEIKHNTSISGHVWFWRDLFGPEDFSTLNQVVHFPVVPAYGFTVSSSQMRFLNLFVFYEWGTRSNVAPPAGRPPVQARYQTGEFDLSILTSRGLTVSNSYLFDRNADLHGAGAMYNSHIARSKWNFQVNRELSFRFIGQYNAVLANPFFTSTPTARGFNADFLITYLVHPGTAFYAGYNSGLSRPGPAIGLIDPNRFVNDGRQLFVKVSYLFRF